MGIDEGIKRISKQKLWRNGHFARLETVFRLNEAGLKVAQQEW